MKADERGGASWLTCAISNQKLPYINSVSNWRLFPKEALNMLNLGIFFGFVYIICLFF